MARMLWRTPRSRGSPPAGFIQPAPPTLVAKPPAGPDWIHEVKHDGYRLLALKSADRVVLRSRHGTDFTDKLPALNGCRRGGRRGRDQFRNDHEAEKQRHDQRRRWLVH